MSLTPPSARASSPPTRLLMSLSSDSHGEPTLAPAGLRDRAEQVLGPQPLAWVSETAEASADLVVEHVTPFSLRTAVVQVHQELLLGLLLELTGRPTTADATGDGQQELIRFMVSREIRLDVGVAALRRVQAFWTARLVAHATARGASPETRLRLVVIATEMMDRYLDARIKDYLAEVERTRREAAVERRRTVEDLVGGRRVDPEFARAWLGLDLDHHHVALVLTNADHSARGLDALALGAARAARALDPRSLLQHEPAPGVLWLWVSGEVAPDVGAVSASTSAEDGVHIGIGSAHPGAAGFRRSHLEAVDAERSARHGTGGSVVLHRDVALAVLLSRDPERARWFVETQLGPLAGPDKAAEELRETLRCFYRSEMRLVTASAQLRVHRNTVIHRLRRIEGLLGHPVGVRVPEVMSAMLLVDLLADRSA